MAPTRRPPRGRPRAAADCTRDVQSRRGRGVRGTRPSRAAGHRRDRAPADRRHPRPPHPPGGADRAAGRRWPHQPRDRCAAVHQPPHRRVPPPQGLHEARHQLSARAARGAAGRPAGARPVLATTGGTTGVSDGCARRALGRSSTSSANDRSNVMKIVVIGGSGRIGSNVVRRLVALGHDPVPASPVTGIDTSTGEGLADVMMGADVVVDVANAPVWDDEAVREFFTTSTRNLLAAERDAGVGHHVAVSIVGADRLPDSGYLRAKVAQEAEIEAGSIPYTILRSTQFFDFLAQTVESGAEGDSVRLSRGLMQLVAADDVAATVTELAIGAPVGGRVELGGPEALGIDDWARRLFAATGDDRTVVSSPHARSFGTELRGGELTPGDGARIGAIDFDTWFASQPQGVAR